MPHLSSGLLCEDVVLLGDEVVPLAEDLLGEGEHVAPHPEHPQEGPHTSQLSSPVGNSTVKSEFELFCGPARARYKLPEVEILVLVHRVED